MKEIWLSGNIASRDPFIYYSTRGTGTPMGAAGLLPDFFSRHPALHLINFTWSMEVGDLNYVAKEYHEAKQLLPENQFVFLCNTEMEALLFARLGLPAFLASPAIFLEDEVFQAPEPTWEPRFNAVYNARLTAFKRHDLARGVGKLALLYGPSVYPEVHLYDETRAILPNAYFANHEMGGGSYRMLSPLECTALLNASHVGLALSAEEGVMRAALEYLLCGLPIVSTRSLGGRERYLQEPYATIVPDDPDAVAAAVSAYVENPIPRADVRAYFTSILAFERHCFLIALNAIVKDIFGLHDRFGAIPDSMRGFSRFRRAGDILKELEAFAAER